MTTDGIYAGKYIIPCTAQLAFDVGENLRWEDKREVEQTSGLSATAAVVESFYCSAYSVFFTVPNGKAAGVAGVTPDNRIWMLCTQASEEYPHTFVREARRWINSLPEKYLWNHADMRNESHIKLLKLLGFTFLKYYTYNGVPLIQFMKLCANP
jgi:hypothetical protein